MPPVSRSRARRPTTRARCSPSPPTPHGACPTGGWRDSRAPRFCGSTRSAANRLGHWLGSRRLSKPGTAPATGRTSGCHFVTCAASSPRSASTDRPRCCTARSRGRRSGRAPLRAVGRREARRACRRAPRDPRRRRVRDGRARGSVASRRRARAVRAGRDPPSRGRRRDAYLMCMPEMLRAMTRRWISDVPSKIVYIFASRCQRSTGYSRT